MKTFTRKAQAGLAAAVLLSACAASIPAFAETLKGRLDVVNESNNTLVVAGITFQTNGQTTYAGGLKNFAGLQQGQMVSVDFDRSGSNVYTAKQVKKDG